jgi:hypothetical protein
MRRAALIAGLILMLPALAMAEPASRQHAGPPNSRTSATSQEPVVLVEASCASLCRQRHNQCRIATRGAPRCDADLQRCLKGCLATKRR